MSFDYELKSNLVAMISNHSQSQSKLQLEKRTELLYTHKRQFAEECFYAYPTEKKSKLISCHSDPEINKLPSALFFRSN